MQQTGGMTRMSKEMQECVDMCLACHSICEETMSYCLQQGGQMDAQIMRALMDCTDMTRMCADMMMRRSPLSAEMCGMCARACEMCVEACKSMPNDAQLTRCAEICRKCAQMCRSMADVRA
ncbi:four-helix bundle copper-binding protein [Peterkaempfera bronchialis]|uniref:Four-helix bundle copper-binding protein n=1 Tax=Peterkaempfera bronchialis TaxID=2126346 RepID=A0A345SSC1_9ACTN|nr:four-helix bundle copper-binding protein [Peterkaempfera bronchialis]AXI76626.1 four-helix bundle copper-binding protein [Peterkaempfera bronchialis]